MDLEQLINSIDIRNSRQVRELQKQLKVRGLYDGSVDGRFGKRTAGAVARYRTELERKEAKKLEVLRLQGAKEQRQAEAANRRAEEDKRALESSPYEVARQTAIFGAPLALGYPLAYKKGTSVLKGASDALQKRAADLSETAKDVRAGRIPRVDAARAARRLGLHRARPGFGPLAVGAGLAGVGLLTRFSGAPYAKEEFGDTAGDATSLFGGFETGVGTGLASQQLINRGTVPTYAKASDHATVFGKDTARPSADDLDARAKTLQNSMTREQIKDQLKKAGQPTSGLKPDLARRLASISATAGKVVKAFPPVAGGLAAYDMATSQAQAADLGETGSTAVGAGAAVAGAGAGYGLQKGAEYVGSKIAGTTAGKVAARAIPGVGAAVLGYDAYSAAYDAARDPESMERRAEYDRIFRQPGGVSAEASRMATPDLGGEPGPGPETEPGDADVARAFQQSPRQTVIELVRQGLDADDIAMLAGVSAGDVEAVVGAIPPQAMRVPQRAAPAADVPAF